jgi:hypothetical protein
MKTRLFLIAGFLLSGCKGPALVVVHIGAVAQVDGIASFDGTATAGGKTAPVHITPSGGAVSIPPEQTFGIQVPSSITGNISVHLTANDSSGMPLSSGDGAGTIAAGGRADLSLVLGGSAADLDMSGPLADAALLALAISPSSFSFGAAAKGSTGTTKAFTVTNNGTADAGPLGNAVAAGSAGTSFTVVGDGCNAMVIAAGASCTVTVQFAPKIAGVLSANLQVGGASAPLSGYAVGSWHNETVSAVDLSGTSGGETLTSVWGSGANDVYTVGNYGGTSGVILHRDAAGVWQVATPPGAQKLFGVWGTSATDIFAVGGNVGGGHASVFHSAGTSFAETFMFSQSAANGIFGLADNNIYLAWNTGTAGPPNSGVWHSVDGVTFTAQTGVGGAGSPPDKMAAIWGSGASDLYAVGPGGLYHSVGDGGWFQQNATANLNSVWGSGATDVYVAGTASVILHSKGDSTWTSQTGPSADLFGVWQSAASDVWIVGTNGTAARSTGDATWSSPASTNSFVTLRAVWGSSSGDIYAVGDAGTVLHYY